VLRVKLTLHPGQGLVEMCAGPGRALACGWSRQQRAEVRPARWALASWLRLPGPEGIAKPPGSCRRGGLLCDGV